ncbi:MAG TPA: hypothetical protein VLI06_21240 [Solimonas sp.]|nr:hypothetical protein [Solimonas sp.]
MKRAIPLALAGLLALSACSDDDAPGVVAPPAGPKLQLPALAPGVHALRLAGDPDAASGLAFVGSDGKAFVQLAPESDSPSRVLYRRAGAAAPWQRVPAAAGDMSLSLALDESRASLAEPAWAGSYAALVGEQPARFSIGADGKLSAGAGDCRLSGSLDPQLGYGEARGLALELSGCAAANGSYRGAILADPDARNARFRAVLQQNDKILDLYLYGV